MTTASVGIIGSGNIGSSVARQAAAAGIPVVIANSRGPESLAELVLELGEGARAGTVEEAAGQPLIVASIPFAAYRSLPAQLLEGKPVIDTMNYYPDRDGAVAELDGGIITSSELVQRHLDEIGYDAVAIGPLAESWRSEPDQPVYVAPYLGAAPAGVTDPAERFFKSAAVQPPAGRVLELAQQATRGSGLSSEHPVSKEDARADKRA